ESLRALKESENKYRHLFAGSKDALFIADKNLLLKEVNQTALQLFGDGQAKLQQPDLYHLIPNEWQRNEIKKLLQENKSITDFQIEIQNQGEEKKTCLLSIVHEQAASGQDFVH